MRTPEEVVAELAPAYDEWKGGEKSKEKLRKEFFSAVETYIAEHGEPEEDLIIVVAADDQSAIEAAEKERPGWKVEAIRPFTAEGDEVPIDNGWECIVVENPKYMPYSVEFDGRVWKKQVAEGAQMLDNERLEADDPELWKRVAAYPMQSLLEDIAYEANVHYTEVEAYIESQCERHGVKRQLKDASEISDKDLGSLQAYTYTGLPTIKLASPTKVKG